jgi:tRNA threonylcarbamoyladenosine biosynthesis protein TsaE
MYYTTYISYSEYETKILAKIILSKVSFPIIFALNGDIGSGKTTFVQGLGKYLFDENNINIQSPTFSLIRKYETIPCLYHIDLYRLINGYSVDYLGINELIFNRSLYVCIEWADFYHIKFPNNTIFINFFYYNIDIRNIAIYSPMSMI